MFVYFTSNRKAVYLNAKRIQFIEDTTSNYGPHTPACTANMYNGMKVQLDCSASEAAGKVNEVLNAHYGLDSDDGQAAS